MYKNVKLNEIAIFKNGKKKPDEIGEIPVYGGNGIFGYTNEFNQEKVLIIGRVGAYCGSVHYEPNLSWVSDNAIAVKNIKGISDILYLKYLLKTLQLNRRRIGTSQPLLTQSILKDISVKVPNLKTQELIANILSSFDNKIENNNAIIANLEEQTQTIFKSWFIDFEPFNEEDMYESELGKIPAGWSIGKVGDVSNLFDSQRKPLSKMKRDRMDKNYPYYGANGIIDYVDDYLFDGKYLLLGEDGTVQTDEGYPILNYINEKFWVSNHAHIMTGDKVSTEFLYVSLKRRNIRDIITGAVQQKINQANLKSIKLILPTKEILNSFQRIVEPMFEQKLLLKKSNNKLEEIRDTLLPKLMSGEIRVEEAITEE